MNSQAQAIHVWSTKVEQKWIFVRQKYKKLKKKQMENAS